MTLQSGEGLAVDGVDDRGCGGGGGLREVEAPLGKEWNANLLPHHDKRN